MTPKEIRQHVSARLRLARKRARLTQDEVAERASITPQEVCYYERGSRIPGLIILPRLCAALGVTANSIVPKLEVVQ